MMTTTANETFTVWSRTLVAQQYGSRQFEVSGLKKYFCSVKFKAGDDGWFFAQVSMSRDRARRLYKLVIQAGPRCLPGSDDYHKHARTPQIQHVPVSEELAMAAA